MPGWFSICAPVGTPADIVQTPNAKVVEIAQTEAMAKVMRGISVEVPLQTPAEAKKFLADDIQRNAEVIRMAKIVLE